MALRIAESIVLLLSCLFLHASWGRVVGATNTVHRHLGFLAEKGEVRVGDNDNDNDAAQQQQPRRRLHYDSRLGPLVRVQRRSLREEASVEVTSRLLDRRSDDDDNIEDDIDDHDDDDDRPQDNEEQKKNDKQQQERIQQYKLWEPQEIRDRVLRWAEHYPDLIRVTTSQEAYGLPTAGGPDDCPYEEDHDGCLNYILTIQDYVAHPEGSDSSNRLPEVLWSGEVHGDEQVGPTSVLEAAQLLMDAATCESLPRPAVKSASLEGGRGIDPHAWEEELSKAKACRRELAEYGIPDGTRQWLARLVTTRRIVIVPTANALGYFRAERVEDGIDANRDFPYDVRDPTLCMQTVAARTLNEVFREHMFQLSLTFHGGMEIVAYEWGAPTWDHYTSPDDTAQEQIAAAYSHYGGGWEGTKPYEIGAMNPQVYPVRGGMEDWAYAASWDPKRVIQCKPNTFDGYPAEKTTYDESNLRVFNMLVETSNHKIPSQDELGSSLDVTKRTTSANGHVSRNIRLSLLSATLVEPYLRLVTVNELTLTDDVIPLASREGQSCRKTKRVTVPLKSRKVVLQWVVGGALEINSTQIWYAKWSDVPDEAGLDCLSLHPTNVESFMKPGTPIGSTSGLGAFAATDAPSAPYSASFELDNDLKPHDELVVIASARVDPSWATQNENDRIGPDVPPQSHVVNARTNPDWHHEHAGKIIQGRLDWFSVPLTIVVGEHDTSVGNNGEVPVATVELSNRFGGVQAGITPATNRRRNDKSPMDRIVMLVVVCGVAAACFFLGRAYVRHAMRAENRSRVLDFIHDETAQQPGLRHKASPSPSQRAAVNGNGTVAAAGGYDGVLPDDLDVEENGHVELGSYRDTT